MQGERAEEDDDPLIYEKWFAVSRDLYWSGWKTAIEGFRAATRG
jgi:hypothetical protein